VSWRLARGLLNFIIVIAVLNCPVGVAVVVVVIVGEVINADEAGGTDISVIVMDTTV
jgi:hypothetical protein